PIRLTVNSKSIENARFSIHSPFVVVIRGGDDRMATAAAAHEQAPVYPAGGFDDVDDREGFPERQCGRWSAASPRLAVVGCPRMTPQH
ncbi:hypothetical protein, partial [Burkholderia pseudomallei]